MPIYNFECKNCDYRISKIMSYREKKLLKSPGPCPRCFKGTEAKYTLYNVLGNSNFVLKGKWFKHGY